MADTSFSETSGEWKVLPKRGLVRLNADGTWYCENVVLEGCTFEQFNSALSSIAESANKTEIARDEIIDAMDNAGSFDPQEIVVPYFIAYCIAGRLAHTPQPDFGNKDDEVIDHFAMLYRQYGLADDATLAPCALKLKAKVLAALESRP